jgi:hypothetical protein
MSLQKRQLYTYEEIQDIECYTDGKDFVIKQIPEYLFTWQKGNTWVNLWVTNNIMEREYSFYQFVKTLELIEAVTEITEYAADEIEVEHMEFIVGTFGQMMHAAKINNQLGEEFFFETGN